MPRIDPVPRETLGDLNVVLAMAESRMGFVPNSQLILAHRPEIVRAFAQLGAAINGPSSTISPQLRNLVSQMASRASGCGYCMAHTTHTAARVGIRPRKKTLCGPTRQARCSRMPSAPLFAWLNLPRKCRMR